MEQRNEYIARTVNENRGKLLSFIRRFVTETDEAEDILQDVFYQFVIGYEDIRSLDQVTSWLFRVARNKVTDSYRKKKPQAFSAITSTTKEGEDPLMLEDILPDLNTLPDQQILTEMIWEKIEHVLESMPTKQREVFVWHEFEQKSFKEIEKVTGDSVNTLISRKRYAVLALRESLIELYDELLNNE